MGALRWDDGDLFDRQFSPKGAVVFSPDENNSFRFSVNKAFQTPNYSEFFLQVPVAAPSAGPRSLETNIENYYAAADVVALPALQEGFGNVVMEALASGLPVLVSRDVGAAEIIHGPLVQGIVDRVEDLRELEEKLLSLLAASRDPNWIREARQIGERHSWENHFKKIEAVLLEACRVPSGVAS